jgi:AcrR family transcriptional regulator
MSREKKRKQRASRRLSPAARRTLIDDAAARVFAERGYEAATMKEIARAAGVVASVIYDHYPSKRDLYIALLEQHGRVLIEGTIRPPMGSDFRAALAGQIDDYFRSIEEDPFLWRLVLHDPPEDAEIEAAQRRVQAAAADAMAAALRGAAPGDSSRRAKELARPVAMVAAMVKASLGGLAAWWWEHRDTPRSEVVSTATTVLWDGLSNLGPRPASARPRRRA